MTYFIFNHRITGQQQLVEAQSIASDQETLFSGSKEELRSLGFTESQIGGFELIDEVLRFNQDLKTLQDIKKKPILSGDELGKKIRSLFKGQTIKERARILKPVLTELSILEKDDEITQLEYNEFKTELILGIGDNLTTEQISQIEQILDDFVLAYRL